MGQGESIPARRKRPVQRSWGMKALYHWGTGVRPPKVAWWTWQQVACDSVAEVANGQIVHSHEGYLVEFGLWSKENIWRVLSRGGEWVDSCFECRSEDCDKWIEAGGGKPGNLSGGYCNSPERGISHLDQRAWSRNRQVGREGSHRITVNPHKGKETSRPMLTLPAWVFAWWYPALRCGTRQRRSKKKSFLGLSLTCQLEITIGFMKLKMKKAVWSEDWGFKDVSIQLLYVRRRWNSWD